MSYRCLTCTSPCRVCRLPVGRHRRVGIAGFIRMPRHRRSILAPLAPANRRARLVRRGVTGCLPGPVLDRHLIEGAPPEIDARRRPTRRSRNRQPQTGRQGDEAYDGDRREHGHGRIYLNAHSGLSEPAPEPGHENSIEHTPATLRRPNGRPATTPLVIVDHHQKNPGFRCFNPAQATRFQCTVADTSGSPEPKPSPSAPATEVVDAEGSGIIAAGLLPPRV